MKRLSNYSFINVLGNIWMPDVTAAQYISLRQYDIDNMQDDEGNITRDSVENWLGCNAGDFRSIIDFHADIETKEGNIVIDWANEENEFTYGDCMNEMQD